MNLKEKIIKYAKPGDVLIIYDAPQKILEINKHDVVLRSESRKGTPYKQRFPWKMLEGVDPILKTQKKDPEYFL